MGGCLSKKTSDSSSPRKLPPAQTEPKPQKSEDLKKLEDQETVKKEIFIIRHRKSHDLDRFSEDENGRTEQKPIALLSDNNSTRSDSTGNNSVVSNLPVRTSSCTKEEVDAILIQCGRLSRSSFNAKSAVSGSSETQTSVSAAAAGGHRRKYSGSKRSYDFDQDGSNSNNENRDDDVADGEEETAAERIHRHRQRQRQSGGSRRRTPSRERDQQQRSGSRERNGSGSGSRRVSRSPNRRSESPVTGNIINNNVVNKPGKMVSVPATITSLVMDKSNNLAGPGSEHPSAAASVKRIQVKRNVSVNVTVNGSEPITRSAASPRSRSPARTNSKAAAAASEVPNANANANASQTLSLSRSNSRKAEQSPYRRNPLGEIDQNVTTMNQKQMMTKAKDVEQEKTILSNVAVTIVPPNAGVGRTRSSRLSRDFDLNPETNQSPPPNSYTALLLEDIQNFHQKNSIATPTNAISLPPCLTKACSILEAVADLNSTTCSKKKTFLSKEPFVESEVVANDDIMQPSIHKYVTVRRGGGGGDIEEVESSGSNSVVGGQQQWSSWEPNSADSTDHWSSSYCSSRYNERDNGDQIDIRRKTSEKKSGGVGRNRVGSGRSLYSSPAMGAATT